MIFIFTTVQPQLFHNFEFTPMHTWPLSSQKYLLCNRRHDTADNVQQSLCVVAG